MAFYRIIHIPSQTYVLYAPLDKLRKHHPPRFFYGYSTHSLYEYPHINKLCLIHQKTYDCLMRKKKLWKLLIHCPTTDDFISGNWTEKDFYFLKLE